MRSFSDAPGAFASYTSPCGWGLYTLRDLKMEVARTRIASREEGIAEMFAIVSPYRAKIGEEDAIIALHEDWQRNQGLKGYLS